MTENEKIFEKLTDTLPQDFIEKTLNTLIKELNGEDLPLNELLSFFINLSCSFAVALAKDAAANIPDFDLEIYFAMLRNILKIHIFELLDT